VQIPTDMLMRLRPPALQRPCGVTAFSRPPDLRLARDGRQYGPGRNRLVEDM